ncbi:MAG: NAD(P)-dependent oxidoreductase [Chromatiaceae bacterium]|nr:NAD(P)-dependent oxidoreductase [Chromatiaceae bacterium]MCP5315520.1 NAD(P)-dependent oxidoreductase [Chromatiaceae bacterium]
MKTTVIGLGAMGAGMAGNLYRAGHLDRAWNRTAQRAQDAAALHGFAVADSLENAAAQADLVITSVSADADLLEIVDRLAPAMTAASVVLDTSTVSIDTARLAAERLGAHGIHFLDAPVSGGKEGAEKGTMVMMVGGDAKVLEQLMPVLDSISRKVVHMGPVGSGQATKAVNQIMCAGINQAVTEALAFGQHQGLDMDKVVDVVSSGAAGNWFVEHRGRSMTSGVFEPGFRVALHHKDLKICQAMLAADHVQLPMVEMTLLHYERLMKQGHGDEDISALYRIKRPLFDEQA